MLFFYYWPLGQLFRYASQGTRLMRRDFPVPQLLIELIQTGRWVHPGDDVMQAKVPFIDCPLVFLGTDEMPFVSLSLMGADEIENELFSEYRGTVVPERPLPWIDVERTLFMMCNKIPGDDVGIALDYRTGTVPRVVGDDWHSGKKIIYREISPSIDAFIELLGL